MQIKKVTSTVLLISMMTLFASPLSAEVTTSTDKSLYNFLKTTDKIEASYKYPSLKLASASAEKTKLPAHSPIMIRCEETITTRDVVSGGTVNFSVLSDVKSSNGTVLIKSGAPVTAQISFAKKKGMIGRSGELTVNDFHTTAVDGTYIPLSASVSSQPDDNMTVSVVLSILICPLFLLMNGSDAKVAVGTTKTAYTIADTYIKIDRL